MEHVEPIEQKYHLGLVDELESTDIFLYAGTISCEGFTKLSSELEKRNIDGTKGDKVVLIINTFGGDPHAGYKMARLLQYEYQNLTVAIPEMCKSAGSLIAIAANEIIYGPLGELGPLDIQTRKRDEMGEQSSTLDIFKALDNLQTRVIESFRHYVTDIKYGSGLNTKLASDIASTLSESLIKPISAQIDPVKLGEQKRALSIAFEYAERLNQKSNNLKESSLNKLIEGYPSHSFVIDYYEAVQLFHEVRKVKTEVEYILNGLALNTIQKLQQEIHEQSFIACDFTKLAKQVLQQQTNINNEEDPNSDETASNEDVKNILDAVGTD
ncbi:MULTISPECIES: hypothetical protein [unclassified Pseudoalteromonas]|jgi:hypothetical protein|uniref:SDH family Clp fold serine proteinase n=1 Tax=unclassified Pseudoalteromonas TaxID=194690 RepID=UPI0023592664|nr:MULTISPECIES: hypothetical protein [unclassified Pseudoalteromonas]MDC9501570.1 hypothetical protein [Pseudoalteromonas sp. Angola-18]MDC9530752.1 hypothetical protein [Pseudoalteromonas sp. Angola-7]